MMKTMMMALAGTMTANAALAAPAGGVAAIQARLADPHGGIVVVAHRGCHNPAPHHGLMGTVPENSRAALERCVAIGADMMETDVRRSADGTLVILHDATVDRTTDGTGAVDRLTWPQLSQLRLRDDEGGAKAPLTEERMLTLDQILALAKGRIMLNLDVKANIYVEVAAAVRRAGMEKQIVIKTEVGPNTPAMAAQAPFDRLLYMPIPLNPDGKADLAGIVTAQLADARPIGVELPRMDAAQLPPVVAIANAHRVRLWINTLWDGFVAGYGGDEQALRDPDAVWGRLYRDGVTILQTDEPEALLRYRATLR
ncbi:glycerophosphodiester phosphodiesterase family protein [uncultured Sphingomonas sp.]|uniref:glycerophosphodiester phosphodiesterase family protein n=2 Tax=uncultured Sphingomonas sp. TaxID=158754 RepID=UPI0025FC0E81|nr:glycerophosphodiester phosphodiesterase family protein [uncultured Sphingomonas sp.]